MKPRVLHVVGEGFGGGSVLIRELSCEAIRNGYEVDVLTVNREFARYVEDDGIGLLQADLIRRPVRPIFDLRATSRLRRLIRRGRYQVVHTHTSKGGVVGRYAAWAAHAPVVIHTVHGFGFHEQTRPLALKAMVSIERQAARHCHRVVTVSDYHRKWAIELGIADSSKVVSIPNGINPARVATPLSMAEARKSLGVASDTKLLIAFGRLAQQKGFEYLLQAVPEIVTDHDVLVAIAGEGPLRDRLRQTVVATGSEKRVKLLGFQPDVASLLKAADMVVLPSEWEGLSISLLEAMAAGKPIVTTSIGSNVEVTQNGQAALLVAPRDHVGLAKAINSLLGAPHSATALGDAAQRRFERAYSQEAMLAKYMALYKNPLG